MDVYKNYEESQGWADIAFGTFSDADDRYFLHEMAEMLAASSKVANYRILDVGFGNGAFMGWCKANNLNCEGVEVNTAQVSKARDAGYVAFSSFEEISKKYGEAPYDAVVGFDVLEHLESRDLVPFLINVKSLCRAHALITFRFPNGDNPFSLWMQNGDLTHRTFIGSGMITQAAFQAELFVNQICAPAHSYDGLSTREKLALFVGHSLRSLIGRFFVLLFMGGQRTIIFAPNLIVRLINDPAQKLNK